MRGSPKKCDNEWLCSATSAISMIRGVDTKNTKGDKGV